MPFDSTKPGNGSLISSSELREQFNALNDLITGLQSQVTTLDARVTALENPPLTAAGFGEPGANGVLTQTGMTNGYPEYSIAGGYIIRYGQVGMNAPRYFILANAMDDLSMARYDNGVSGATLTGNIWQQGAGAGPMGMIS